VGRCSRCGSTCASGPQPQQVFRAEKKAVVSSFFWFAASCSLSPVQAFRRTVLRTEVKLGLQVNQQRRFPSSTNLYCADYLRSICTCTQRYTTLHNNRNLRSQMSRRAIIVKVDISTTHAAALAVSSATCAQDANKRKLTCSGRQEPLRDGVCAQDRETNARARTHVCF
jgi:hypothetical protein